MEKVTTQKSKETPPKGQYEVISQGFGVGLTIFPTQDKYLLTSDGGWYSLMGPSNSFDEDITIPNRSPEAEFLDQILDTAVTGIIESLRSDPQRFGQEHDQERHFILNVAHVHPGWAIDGRTDPKVWEKIKSPAIALCPGGRDFREKEKTENTVSYYSHKFGENVLVFLIPDSSSTRKWETYFILPSDLNKDPEILLKELINVPEDDSVLRAAKKGAYLLLTGNI